MCAALLNAEEWPFKMNAERPGPENSSGSEWPGARPPLPGVYGRGDRGGQE